jgi:hypothetical protein
MLHANAAALCTYSYRATLRSRIARGMCVCMQPSSACCPAGRPSHKLSARPLLHSTSGCDNLLAGRARYMHAWSVVMQGAAAVGSASGRRLLVVRPCFGVVRVTSVLASKWLLASPLAVRTTARRTVALERSGGTMPISPAGVDQNDMLTHSHRLPLQALLCSTLCGCRQICTKCRAFRGSAIR